MKRVGRVVAQHLFVSVRAKVDISGLNGLSKQTVEEKPSQISAGRKVRAGQGTVVANSHPGRPAGKCHRKYTADAPMRAGKGEMVR